MVKVWIGLRSSIYTFSFSTEKHNLFWIQHNKLDLKNNVQNTLSPSQTYATP